MAGIVQIGIGVVADRLTLTIVASIGKLFGGWVSNWPNTKLSSPFEGCGVVRTGKFRLTKVSTLKNLEILTH